MEKIVSVTTVKRTQVVFTADELDEIMIKQSRLKGGDIEVNWEGSAGYPTGCVVVQTIQEKE